HELKRLFAAAAAYHAESRRITRKQQQSGTTDQSAVSQAEAQLESTQAQAIAVGVTRAQLEHAIAVLIGKPPAEFSILPTEAVIAVPVIPAEMPSALLERRPDIAALERLMASANAQTGIAPAAVVQAAQALSIQYLAVTLAYSRVIVADHAALTAAVTAVNIRQTRLVASAAVIQALGDGWDAGPLPTRERIQENAPLNFGPF